MKKSWKNPLTSPAGAIHMSWSVPQSKRVPKLTSRKISSKLKRAAAAQTAPIKKGAARRGRRSAARSRRAPGIPLKSRPPNQLPHSSGEKENAPKISCSRAGKKSRYTKKKLQRRRSVSCRQAPRKKRTCLRTAFLTRFRWCDRLSHLYPLPENTRVSFLYLRASASDCVRCRGCLRRFFSRTEKA